MPSLLKYDRTFGTIVGVWESNSAALLATQQVPDDPTWGYLLVDVATPTDALETRWAVRNGVLIEKAALTLVAAPNPFPADATTVCQITLSPFVPCTLLLNQSPYALTPDDPVLALSADVPERFTVTLAPLPTHWALPLTVEAL